MKDIVIKTIDHHTHRYPTVGDYVETDQEILITVSKMSDWRYEACVAIHEFTEKLLCKLHGIKDADIDAFDIDFEKTRHPNDKSEPGNHPKAPYRQEHLCATRIERQLAMYLGVNWDVYGKEVEDL